MEQGRDHHQQSTIGKTGIQPIFAVFWRVAPLQTMVPRVPTAVFSETTTQSREKGQQKYKQVGIPVDEDQVNRGGSNTNQNSLQERQREGSLLSTRESARLIGKTTATLPAVF